MEGSSLTIYEACLMEWSESYGDVMPCATQRGGCLMRLLCVNLAVWNISSFAYREAFCFPFGEAG